ncbi:alpha/beta hydrolase [Chryseobacterium aquaticum]|uniref:alpha/beta hydrolase n=1 Tax=Chryseobacterium aquaticum TaxID=452084 RepID=UPI002FC98A72
MMTLHNITKWRTLTFFAITLLLSSCNIQKQVWFSDIQQKHEKIDDGISRVYIDKYGYVYPENQYVSKDKFFDPKNNGSDLKELTTNGNLWDYYKNDSAEYHQLAAKYKVIIKKIDSVAFDAIQENIITQHVDQLKEKLGKSEDNTLVVLVHGFNVEDGTEDFNFLKKEINTYKTNDYVYLDVYWDGNTTGNLAAPLKTIWGKAQLNSGYVAMALRRILAKMDTNTRIKIIAHSLGSSVTTGALFSTYSKFKYPPVDLIKENLKYPTSNARDIRLGLIAPAIPGENTFVNFFERGQVHINKETNTISKIVLGININDIAVSKAIRMSKKMGSTSLGGDKDEYENTKAMLVKKLQYTQNEADQLLQKVEFTNAPKYKSAHGIKYYFMQDDKKNDFLKAIFD